MEIWKDVLGFEGFYKASNLGEIYSCPRKGTKGGIRKKTVCKTNGGYELMRLSNGEKTETKLVSHVIWEAFNGPIPEGMEINHRDENKLNSHLENLELVDRKTNCNWGTRNERIVESRRGYGAMKRIIQYDFETKAVVGDYKSAREASRKTGIDCGDISKCARGLLGHTGRYTWEYEKKEVV